MVQILPSVSAAPTGCRCASSNQNADRPLAGSVTLDGQRVAYTQADTTLVELARRFDISLAAPCHDAEQRFGCCNACVIEVDGRQRFACTTAPADGMDIVVSREDLVALRRERFESYRAHLLTHAPGGMDI